MSTYEAFLATRKGDLCDNCEMQFAYPGARGVNRSSENIHICVACDYEQRVVIPLREAHESKARSEVAAIKARRNRLESFELTDEKAASSWFNRFFNFLF